MLTRRAVFAALAATNTDPHWLSIAEAAAAIRARKLSPVELTRHCLARIAKLNPTLNAFITVTADQAVADAKALENQKPRGPLHGIPIALKDLYDTKGIRTTAASKQYANRIPTEDADVVRLLKAAGAIIIGKANMDEFAYNYTGETSAYGTARNPWNPALSPGGSSGGSAVAVAAGLCVAALGSDTGGSIRLPAAFCGITGYKPTWGQLSANGVLPLAWTLHTVGPMAPPAADAEAFYNAIGGRPPPTKAPQLLTPPHPTRPLLGNASPPPSVLTLLLSTWVLVSGRTLRMLDQTGQYGTLPIPTGIRAGVARFRARLGGRWSSARTAQRRLSEHRSTCKA